jgi:hypothetical protein
MAGRPDTKPRERGDLDMICIIGTMGNHAVSWPAPLSPFVLVGRRSNAGAHVGVALAVVPAAAYPPLMRPPSSALQSW